MPDQNTERLLLVSKRLGSLINDVTFVGGAVMPLLITDPAAPASRPTFDVDLIVEVATTTDYLVRIGDQLRRAGFSECATEHAPICAWTVAGIRVDVMPTTPHILGFSNRWYPQVARTAQWHEVQQQRLRVIHPALFLATKFEAFAGRGGGDYYASHDLEDIVSLIDGRVELIDEATAAGAEVGEYLREQFAALLSNPDFLNALLGHVVDEQREEVVLSRIATLAGN